MRSFAMGNGQSTHNGPGSRDWVRTCEGWDIRPVSSWTLTIGQDPQ